MHITLIQCNGLESSKKFFEKKNVRKNIFVKKNSMKKKQIWIKKIVGNFPKFLSSDIFQRSCEKQCFLYLEHF